MVEGRLPSSFRDPGGFVFARDGAIYRQINRVSAEDWGRLLKSGLYEGLVSDGLALSFESEGLRYAQTDEAIEVIRPERVPLITYPYEWSFSQLQDAALLTLEVMRRALAQGFWLKDASAYNVQFLRGKPIHVDTLSLEPYQEGEPWIAYGQFCRHFLAPLALAAYVDIRLFGELRSNIDGIPLDLASKLLPGKTKMNFGLLTHIHMHGGAQADSGSGPVKKGSISKIAILGMVGSLDKTVRGLKWEAGKTTWGDYYDNTNYSKDAFEAKKGLVAEFAKTIAPEPTTCWDLGANTGVFSEVIAGLGIETWAWDIDPSAVEQAYLKWRGEKRTNLVPLLQDFSNPSPDLGWANRERDSFVARGPADLVLALALIHHLAIGNNVPLPAVADWIHGLGRSVILEFVPKEDSQVQRMLRTRKDVFADYDVAGFERAFDPWFEVVRKEMVPGTHRVLYLLQGKSV